MFFNEAIKQSLLPFMKSKGFRLIEDYRSGVKFSSFRTLFSPAYLEVRFSYDYSFSKEFSFYICCVTKVEKITCLEDHEIVDKLKFRTGSYEKLSEDEQIQKTTQYYQDLFFEKSDIILNKKAFLNL
jgi:hypothetical protein